MKIVEKRLHLNINAENLPDGALFLDIETTGLKKETTHIYLFGCMSRDDDGTWLFRQWFLDSPFEEGEALTDIIDYITKFKILVHFNGDRFDLPFLDYHARERSLSSPFLEMSSLDIYKKVKPLKKLFHMENARLKSFERLLGVYREDKYGGGELIDVYRTYQKNQSPELLKLLLLHNEEDVIGMADLLELLPYAGFFEKDAEMISAPPEVISLDEREIFLRFALPASHRLGAVSFIDEIFFGLKDNHIDLKLPICCGELKYFYPHHKEYYYLPKEDIAVHKSLATYVNPAFRERATAENCYTRCSGSFFPLLPGCDARAFKKSADGEPYALLDENALNDVPFWNSYLRAVLYKIRKS